MRKRLIGVIALLVCGFAFADSWAPPKETQTLSADKQTRVTITPRPLGGALPYFKDKVAGKAQAGQRRGNPQAHPMASMERRNAAGRWQPAWRKPLVNDVGPVSALVANGGRLVTFDNWHSTGHGPDAVVIYDEQGDLVRKLALTDFLPESYVAALPRSVSSLWWGGEHRLDEKNGMLVLRVREPGDRIVADPLSTVDVRIRLADGQVLQHGGQGWSKAMATVAKLDADRQARWDALRVLRASPLHVPRATDAKAWRAYMEELRDRLNASSDQPHAGLVLPLAESDSHYPDSADGITSMLEQFVEHPEFSTKNFVLVSPSSPALATLLASHLDLAAPQSMKGARISFVGTQADFARIQTASLRAGVKLVLIDQQTTVPGMTLPKAVPEWFR